MTRPPFRILVTGDRHAPNTPHVRRHIIRPALTHAAQAVGAHGPIILVHGDAAGVDTIAARVAAELGWTPEPHPARWDTDGYPQAGPLRNQRMVDTEPHICIAWPGPNSRGTWDCVRRAHHAGIPVINGHTIQPIHPPPFT